MLLWLIAIFFGLLASIARSFGNNLMKLGHIRQDKIMSVHSSRIPRFHQLLRPPTLIGCFTDHGSEASEQLSLPWKFGAKLTWWIGMLNLVVVNLCFSLLAYGYGAVTLIAPLSSLPMVWDVFFSTTLLREPYTQSDLTGSILIIFGCVITCVAADKNYSSYTSVELLNLFTEREFMFYCITIGIWFLFLIILGIKGGKAARVGFGTLAGTIGGQRFLVKSVAEVYKNNIFSLEIWQSIETYLLILAALTSIISGLGLLTCGLQFYEAIKIVPLYCGFVCFFGSVSGLVFFHEWENMHIWQFILYPCGLFSIFIGLIYMSYYRIISQVAQVVELSSPSSHRQKNIKGFIPSYLTECEEIFLSDEEMSLYPDRVDKGEIENRSIRPVSISTSRAMREAPARMADRIIKHKENASFRDYNSSDGSGSPSSYHQIHHHRSFLNATRPSAVDKNVKKESFKKFSKRNHRSHVEHVSMALTTHPSNSPLYPNC